MQIYFTDRSLYLSILNPALPTLQFSSRASHGGAIFSAPFGLVIADLSDVFYVSDINQLGIFCVDSTGFVTQIYSGAMYQAPRHLALDPLEKYLYVTDLYTQILKQSVVVGSIPTIITPQYTSALLGGILVSSAGDYLLVSITYEGTFTLPPGNTYVNDVRERVGKIDLRDAGCKTECIQQQQAISFDTAHLRVNCSSNVTNYGSLCDIGCQLVYDISGTKKSLCS